MNQSIFQKNNQLCLTFLVLVLLAGCTQEEDPEARHEDPGSRRGLTAGSPTAASITLTAFAYQGTHGNPTAHAKTCPTYEVNLVLQNNSDVTVRFDRVEAAWVSASGQTISINTSPTETEWKLAPNQKKDFWHTTDGYTESLLYPVYYSVTIRRGQDVICRKSVVTLPPLTSLPLLGNRDLVFAEVVPAPTNGVPLSFEEPAQQTTQPPTPRDIALSSGSGRPFNATKRAGPGKRTVALEASLYGGVDPTSMPAQWDISLAQDEIDELCSITVQRWDEHRLKVGRLTAPWCKHPVGSVIIVGRDGDFRSMTRPGEVSDADMAVVSLGEIDWPKR